MEKTKFESSKTNTATGEPVFNAGLAYLERMHKLSLGYHMGRMEGRLDVALDCLSGLVSEAIPRFTSEEIERLRTKRDSIMTQMNVLTTKQPYAKTNITQHSLSRSMIDLFEDVNICMHKHGLVMPNKDDVTSALKV